MRIYYRLLLLLLLNVGLLLSYYSSGQLAFNILPIVPSLISSDHTSEGFMVTLCNGTIIHFFRFDPGPNGDHTGNSGRIAKRCSTDGGTSWGAIDTVYNDQYDDRNIDGGILSTGRIIITFRRYDANLSQHIDYGLIYSDDGGNTWSSRQVISSQGDDSDTQKMLPFVPGRGYFIQVNKKFYIETRFSNDGINWNTNGHTWDYTTNHQYLIDEACFAYTKNGKIIGLMRNDTSISGANYFQVSSGDYGNTWTQPVHTNIANSYFCPSPLIFYDQAHDDLWVIATDRRSSVYPANINSKIWVYRSKVDSIFQNPSHWTLIDTLLRPYPNTYQLYGYPCATLKQNGNFLVVFTESYHAVHECANFYQFEIATNVFTTIQGNNISFTGNLVRNYPNPVATTTSIEYEITGNINNEIPVLFLYDGSGRIIHKYLLSAFHEGKNRFVLDCSSFISGIYYYGLGEPYLTEKKKMIVIK